jgi:hypothetical protein
MWPLFSFNVHKNGLYTTNKIFGSGRLSPKNGIFKLNSYLLRPMMGESFDSQKFFMIWIRLRSALTGVT